MEPSSGSSIVTRVEGTCIEIRLQNREGKPNIYRTFLHLEGCRWPQVYEELFSYFYNEPPWLKIQPNTFRLAYFNEKKT
jgi:hypothetical protein